MTDLLGYPGDPDPPPTRPTTETTPTVTKPIPPSMPGPGDPWLPHSLPQQLAALGALYRDALEQGSRTRDEALASIGWRLYAAVFFASGLAPLQHLSELTSLTVGELGSVLAEYADDPAPRTTDPVLAGTFR